MILLRDIKIILLTFKYRNSRAENTQLELATRFVSLANVANVQKDRFIYAVSVTPIDNMRITDLIEKTTDEIDCPYNKVNLPAIIAVQQNNVIKFQVFI